MNREEMLSFGVFKPVGHVLLSFPDQRRARGAADAIGRLPIDPGDIHYIDDREMLAGADADLERAGVGAKIGQDLNLIRAHRELAAEGYHWVLARASDHDQAVAIADAARPFDAARAQYYGRLIVEELIRADEPTGQRNESPDTGLDPGTASGEEADRVDEDGTARRH